MVTTHYQFTTAAELKTFLDQFKATDLDAVYLQHKDNDYLSIGYRTEKLTDGSEVISLIVD